MEFGTTLPTSPGLCLYGRGFFISIQMIKSTSLQCQMDTRLIWSCSSRSLEPNKENDTQNGCPKLPEMVRQCLLLKSFSASKWLWLGFSSKNICSECPPMASNRPGLYSLEFGCSSPTSSKNLGSKTAQ
jgi:hypothetical protein